MLALASARCIIFATAADLPSHPNLCCLLRWGLVRRCRSLPQLWPDTSGPGRAALCGTCGSTGLRRTCSASRPPARHLRPQGRSTTTLAWTTPCGCPPLPGTPRRSRSASSDHAAQQLLIGAGPAAAHQCGACPCSTPACAAGLHARAREQQAPQGVQARPASIGCPQGCSLTA